MRMLNKRTQILFDNETWQIIRLAAKTMDVSIGEAVRKAAKYSYKTKKIHQRAYKMSDLRAELAEIHKGMKPLKLTFKEIKEMVEYGRRY